MCNKERERKREEEREG
jgi:hypothetical protein